jgi:hypothetical protein
MDNKQKTKHEKVFQKGDFSFPFEKCKAMAEMIRTYCAGGGRMAECCFMMKEMMGGSEGEQTTRKKKETEEKNL